MFIIRFEKFFIRFGFYNPFRCLGYRCFRLHLLHFNIDIEDGFEIIFFNFFFEVVRPLSYGKGGSK